MPLKLVYVEDFYTTGLDGPPHDSSSRFHRFLLSVGDSGKVHDGHNTGGSYGFGKSAFSSNSGIRTIFAYSRYRGEDNAPHTRLFGCGYFRSHRFGGGEFNGRAWLGCSRDANGSGAQIVDPLEDEVADTLAVQLGFGLRALDQFGTSVLIVDTALEAEDLKGGVEEWWWPRLVDNELDVEVISPDGSRHVPRPRARPDLRPFIDAYEIAIGTNPNPTAGRERRQEFRRMHGLELGVCGLKVLDVPTEGENYPVPEERLNSMALIRVPGMVVQYYRRWQQGTPVLAGVFVASEQIDDTLKLSEPPAHDRWHPESSRLRDLDDNHRRAVQSVLGRIYQTVRTFRKDASPPPPPKSRRFSTLERELANFLVGRGPKQPIEHSSAPINLQFVQSPEAVPTNDGRLRVRAEFQVQLKDDADIQATRLRLKVKCVVLEDRAEGDPVAYNLQSDADGLSTDETDPNSFFFPIDHEAPVRFSIVSDPYDPLWTVRLQPDIEPVAARPAE